MTAVLQNQELSQTTFVLTLFLGFIAIIIHRVFSSSNRQAFQKTLITGALFSAIILGLEAACFFVYGDHR
jgi:hypothetical protein